MDEEELEASEAGVLMTVSAATSVLTFGDTATRIGTATNTFKGIPLSTIKHAAVIDEYIGMYTATLNLDERELRTLAGQLRGTVGVEHAVDTFVGLASFGITGSKVLGTSACKSTFTWRRRASLQSEPP
eukprot:356852-Rhodomonas_salina.2